jgi:hypothetical protein
MATFKVTPETSAFTTFDGEHAFDIDTAGADTLIVDAGAFLITAGVFAAGAFLKNAGAWKVTVNGTIVGNQYAAIALAPDNAATSTITVGKDGEVSGDSGVILGSAAIIKNAGIISGTDRGIVLYGSGKTTITNTGTLSGVTHAFLDSSGTSNDMVTNSGMIIGDVSLGGGVNTLTNSGWIDGSIFLGNGTNKVTNTKNIVGAIDGAASVGADTIVNSASLGGVFLGNGNNKLTNAKSGWIGKDNGGSSYRGGDDEDTITNAGTMSGNVLLSWNGVSTVETNKLTNSGKIESEVFGGRGADTVINSGTIGGVFPGHGANTLRNAGTVGKVANTFNYFGGNDADIVINSKLIVGHVDLGNGTNTLTNSGTITGDVIGGGGVDTIVNTGTIQGKVLLGNGDDKYTGGKFVDLVHDSNGSDTIVLGAGNDEYVATGSAGLDGTDTIDGGAGIDHYNAGNATDQVLINLDTIQHGTLAANTATGTNVAGAFKDTIKNFENATGGSGVDALHGSAAANTLDGGGGNDDLYGYGGNDILNGGAGLDFLTGGAGRDSLYGGPGTDFFVFESLTDSGPTKGTRDVIQDFTSGEDFIILEMIDANTKMAGNQEFSFIGTNTGFSGTAGELRAYWSAAGQIIEGDVNGDKKADFSIEIVDPNHLIVLKAADFSL